MNSIKINIALPKASELKSDLNALLTQVKGKTSLNLELDITSFKASIGEVSQLLGKLKSQVSSLGGFESLINTNLVNKSTKAIEEQSNAIREQQKLLDSKVLKTSNTKIANSDGNDVLIKDLEQIKDEYGNIIEVVNKYNSKTGEITSTIVKTTNEIEKQRLENEKLLASTEKVKNNLQGKLNESLSNKNFTLIDDSVFTNLQNKINSINTNTSEKEIKELQSAINNLGNSDSQIVRLQNAISKYEVKIDGLKGKYKNLVPKAELNEAIERVNELKNVLAQVQSGENTFTNKTISSVLNDAGTGMNKLGNATKIASEEQRLYNKEVVSFSSAFKDVATKVGLFSVVYTAMNKVQSTFREGFQSVIDMDTEITNLNKVVDLSSSQLLKMRDSAITMGEALGTSGIKVAKAQAEFGRMYKDMETINEMTKVSIIGQNVMDNTSADQVAKGLTTIINSLKLDTKDAITIIDSLNEVQNNFRVESSEMLDALSKVGSTANVAGASLQELEGYITSLSVSTGKSGSEIGESLKSITSRIYKIGSEGIDSEGKPEEMLKEMGVAVRDLNGEFRPLNEILSDLSVKWKTMSDTQKIATAQVVAGQHKYNDFISLLNNFDMATEATATAMNSVGSAVKENEKYLSSIQGKIESLKTSVQGFFLNFINSDMIKGGVDALQSLMHVLNGFQGTFGSVGLSVGALSSAFLIFTNNPLRQFADDIVKHKTTLGGLSDILNQVKLKLAETGTGMNVAQKSSLALRTGFTAVGNSALFAQIKVMALQAVLSAGLSFAIMAVIGAVSGFVGSFKDAESRIEAVDEKSKALSDTLNNFKEVGLDLSSFEEVNKKLKDTNLSEEERNDLNNQLVEVKKSLSTLDDSAYSILNNQNLSYEEQLSLLKQINEQKLYDRAKELDDQLGNGWGKDESKNAEYSNQELEKTIRLYKEIKALSPEGGSVRTEDGNGLLIKDSIEKARYLKELEDVINSNYSTVQKYNSNIELMKRANYDTDRSTIDLSNSTKQFMTDLNASTDALNKNTNAKNSNTSANVPAEVDTISVEQATQNYGKAVEEVEKLDTLLQKINKEQQLTPDIVAELSKNYSDLGAGITDISTVQEYLNKKINEQVAIQQEAYQIMVGDDEKYYQEKIMNSQEAQNAFDKFASQFVDVNGGAYDGDLKNFRTLNEAKAGFIGQLSKPLSEFLANLLGGSADTYRKELQNTKNYAEAKAYILAKLDEQITKAENRLNSFAEKSVQSATSIDALNNEKFATKALQQIKTIQTERAKIETSFNEFYASFNTSAPTFGQGSSLMGGSGNKDKKATEKEIANMGKLKDRYMEVENALTQLNNELEKNRVLMENTSDKEKLKYLDKELQLIKKQEVAYKNKNKELNKELAELKKSLTSNGFKFGEGGVISNASRIDGLVTWANSLSGDNKKQAQENVKEIYERLKRYNDLLIKEIPEVNKELLELANTTAKVNEEIKSIYREKLESVASVESKISDLIKKNAEERIEAEKKALEKSMENDRKRIESKKKALKEEQDLYNKQYSEDNYEAQLNEERNKLLQLQSEIDKLQFANDKKSQQRLSELLTQYENQQKLINDKIAEHQNQAINDRFEKEQELIDKELEDKENAYDNAIEELDKKLENFLTPQNLTNLVSSAMKSGFVDILGETVSLKEAMNEMFRDTEVGVANLNLQFNDFLDGLNSIKDVIGDINGLVNGAGMTGKIDMSAVGRVASQPIKIDMGGIVVQGNLDRDVLPDLEKMFKKQEESILNIVTKKLSGTR